MFGLYKDDSLRSPFDPYGINPPTQVAAPSESYTYRINKPLRSQFDPRRSPPNWLTQQELAPVDSSNYPIWWTKRNGITPNGFPFKMTQEEFEKIYYGSDPTMSRSNVINYYNLVINYFNQLDYSFPPQIKNFNDWKTWWGKSLDLVIPKSDLVDEYNAIFFKGSEHTTFTDTWKLYELERQIYPLPQRDDEPIMFDLASHSRAFPFILNIKWDFNIESNYEKFARMNRGGSKYKKSKKHKKSKKSGKSGKSKKSGK